MRDFIRRILPALWLASAASWGTAQSVNLEPPPAPVNLLWIHHSVGSHWYHKYDPDDTGGAAWNDGVRGVSRGPDAGIYATRHRTSSVGGNGEVALYNNNYLLHHLSYGSALADGEHFTDYRDWHRKFRDYLDGGDTAHYVNDVGGEDLRHCYAQDISYDEQGADEFTSASVTGQTNQVIMFKSCFPNSAIAAPDTSTGLPANPTLAAARAWIAGGGYDAWVAAGEAAGPLNFIQAEYLALLDVFGEARYRNLLFVAWVAPPETNSIGAYARPLADWFETEWLADYAHDNVLLFNYWNIHTGAHQANGNSMLPCVQRHNHARFNPFLNDRDYVGPGDPDFVDDIRLCFPGWFDDSDSHPSHFGGAVATKELVNLLNIQWNRMNGIAPSGPTGYPTNGQTLFARLDYADPVALLEGVSRATIDGVECLVFDGSPSALHDLGTADVVGAGGAFSYCYWYRPNANSVAPWEYATVLRKDGVFESNHYADYEIDSHVNTLFDGAIVDAPDRAANIVDCDTWTHVAFTWDGGAARHYVDGVQIVETYAMTRTATDNANHLFLGGGGGRNLNGAVREVAVYSRALSSAEVRAIFAANAASTRPTASAAYWLFY